MDKYDAKDSGDDDSQSSNVDKKGGFQRLLEAVTPLGTMAAIVISILTLYSTNSMNVRQYGLTERGQLADRFAKSIDQLGSDSIDVRVGAIYSLRNIGLDNGSYRKPVVQILLAYATRHSEQMPCSKRIVGQDVEIAMQAVGALPESTESQTRRSVGYGINDLYAWRRPANCWRGINLADLDFQNRSFDGADFTGADLSDTKFGLAFLGRAIFHGVDFGRAVMQGTIAPEAQFQGAQFNGAHLDKAILDGSNFCNSLVFDTTFHEANLMDVDFSYSSLVNVDFSTARGLDMKKFVNIKYDGNTKWPLGFEHPPNVDSPVPPLDCMKFD